MSAEKIGEQLQRNLEQIRQRMAAACAAAGRDVQSVHLVAVTKYARWEWVEGLLDLGVRDLGESRPQQLAERRARGPADVRWHLIGHLQRNKSELVVGGCDRIHSVDSWRLLAQLQATALKRQIEQAVLLEVNVSGEASKDGFSPDELLAGLDQLAAADRVRTTGLMTMAPLDADPAAAPPCFERLAALRDEISTRIGAPLPELSMGMSGDFESAIACGATWVRIGSSLFAGLDGEIRA